MLLVLLTGRGASRCGRFWERPQLVLDPLQVLTALESSLELFHILVERHVRTSGKGFSQLLFGSLRRIGLEEFLIETKFPRLNLGQPIDWLQRGGFLQEFRPHVLCAFVLRYEGRS